MDKTDLSWMLRSLASTDAKKIPTLWRKPGGGAAWYAGGRKRMPPGDGEDARKDGEALMSADVVDDIYEGSHRVGIYLVNGRQILLVPILDINCRSDAAEIYDYPMEPAVLGKLVLALFDQMESQALVFREKYKDYWLMPKGITSWRKFENATFRIYVETEEDGALGLYRCYASGRGFMGESDDPSLVLRRNVSALELGESILAQLAVVVEKQPEYTLKFAKKTRKRKAPEADA